MTGSQEQGPVSPISLKLGQEKALGMEKPFGPSDHLTDLLKQMHEATSSCA